MILQALGPLGDGPLVAPDAVPVLAAGILGLVAIALAATLLRGPARRRAHGTVGVAIPGALALGYGAAVAGLPERLGAASGSAGPVARFTTYAFALLLAVWLLARLGRAGRELGLVLAVATLGHVGGVAGWLLLSGDAALAAIGTAAVLGLVLLYLLVGALGGGVDGDRGLLFAKLRGFLVLGWALVLLALAVSPRGVGVLDAGVTALVGAYLDVVLAGGLGAVVVGSGPALDALAGAEPSGGEGPDPVDGDEWDGAGDARAGEGPGEPVDGQASSVEPGSEHAADGAGGGRPGDPEPTD